MIPLSGVHCITYNIDLLQQTYCLIPEMNLRSVVVVLILLVSSVLILVEAASVKANRKAAHPNALPRGGKEMAGLVDHDQASQDRQCGEHTHSGRIPCVTPL